MIASGTKKIEWSELPSFLQESIENRLNSQVQQANSRPGGFTPGMTSVLLLSSGRSVFVKAMSRSVSTSAYQMYEKEIDKTSALVRFPHVPRLLDSFVDGEWVVLIFEAIDGDHPHLPWRDEELDFIIKEIYRNRTIRLGEEHKEKFGHIHEIESFQYFQNFKDEPERLERLGEPWIKENLDRLIGSESRWKQASTGEDLIHFDIRADQILMTPSQVYIVDWPHAGIGAWWVDIMGMLPSIVMQQGPSVETILHRSEFSDVEKWRIHSVITGMTGYFLWSSLLPPLKKVPTLREFQKDQGQVLLNWLKGAGQSYS